MSSDTGPDWKRPKVSGINSEVGPNMARLILPLQGDASIDNPGFLQPATLNGKNPLFVPETNGPSPSNHSINFSDSNWHQNQILPGTLTALSEPTDNTEETLSESTKNHPKYEETANLSTRIDFSTQDNSVDPNSGGLPPIPGDISQISTNIPHSKAVQAVQAQGTPHHPNFSLFPLRLVSAPAQNLSSALSSIAIAVLSVQDLPGQVQTPMVESEGTSGGVKPENSVGQNSIISKSQEGVLGSRLVVISAHTGVFTDFLEDLEKQHTNKISQASIDGFCGMKNATFEHLHFCVCLNDTCEEKLSKLRSFLLSEPPNLTKTTTFALHFDFAQLGNWPQVAESLKVAYYSLLDVIEEKYGARVDHCSLIKTFKHENSSKSDISVYKDLEQDFLRWKSLKVLDIGQNSFRTVSQFTFPDSLHALNLGGWSCIQTLAGLKLPIHVKYLDVSHQVITSLDEVSFPQLLETLNLRGNRIYFMNHVELPHLLKHLDVSQNRLDSLKNVNFPKLLTHLLISHNSIECIKGVRFPEALEYLDASCIPNESMTGIKFPVHLEYLNLQLSMTNTRGLKLPPYVKNLNLACNGVNSINPLKLPNSIVCLFLAGNNIKTLNKVVFPTAIREIYLGNNMITTLKNVQFPPTLEVLDMEMNPHNDDNEKYITSLKDVYFPAYLRVLRLGYHMIKNIEAVEFPFALEELSLRYNDIRVFRNVKFGPKIHTVDLSGNQNLLGMQSVHFPESLRFLKFPSVALNSVPVSVIDRANKAQLKLAQSMPYCAEGA